VQLMCQLIWHMFDTDYYNYIETLKITESYTPTNALLYTIIY